MTVRRRDTQVRPAAAAIGAALLALTLSHSCKVYDESLLEGSGSSPVPADQWGSGIGWWSTQSGGCVSAGFPTQGDRPKNTPADSIGDLHFAISSMALGSLDRKGEATDGAWKTLGLDLDGLCTTSETCAVEPKTFACASVGSAPGDGRECRDNTFGRLEADAIAVEGLGVDFGLSNDAFNCALCRGDYNFVFRISGWNGTPDDESVRLDFYPSPGLEKKPAWQCDLKSTGAWKKNSCWGAKDKWTIQKGTTDGSVKPGALPNALLSDPSAYVRDGFVVGQLPENTLFWFPGKSAAWAYPLKLQRAVVVAKLVEKSGSYAIEDGTIAGRARTTDLVQAFEDLGLCEGHSLYGLMKGQVALNADLLSNGTNVESAPCDALSVGIGFDARPASFGAEAPAVALPGCPTGGDGGVDAGTDGGPKDGGGKDGG